MDLNQLKVFNMICEKKSFSSAAKSLYITQSTVSSHIRNLEHTLGIQLINRKNKSQELLTEAGKVFYDYTKSITPLINEAELAIASFKDGYKGKLSIATSPTILNWFLIDILKSFKKKYPSIELILHSSFTPETIEMVLSRKVQFGIIRHTHDTYTDPLLKTEPIASDSSVLICSSNHKLSDSSEVSLDELVNEEFIAYARDTNYWRQINDLFNEHSFKPNITMELSDLLVIKKMVSDGLGIAIVPQIAVEKEIEEGRFSVLHIRDFPMIQRYSFLVYREDYIFSGPSKNFYNIISEKKFFLE